MHRKPFHFKQFKIYHDKCSMKVGTDGVLLGAWADTSGTTKILDIGTGTGLIAIMLAQRTLKNVIIDAVEIEENAYEQALENRDNCIWKNQINIHHSSIQEYADTTTSNYDLIISNPPFFLTGSKSKDIHRNIARHTQTLTQEDLISSVSQLLSPLGRFALILPVEEGKIFITRANQSNLYCSKITKVKPKINKPFERMLMEFTRVEKKVNFSELVIQHENRNDYTSAYVDLTRGFYTIMS
ncbi:MAG: methyltransferase [Cyclobacteriaceae bacterium]|nr:methyltransferase [Cyclobacteriaceae bacterium]